MAASKRSSRSRDPEFAAKQKAFMQKVVTATMDASNQESSAANTEVEANGLKRKLNLKTSNEPSDDSPAKKLRKSSRNSTSGTVRNLLNSWGFYWSSLIKVDVIEKIRESECLHFQILPQQFHRKILVILIIVTEVF